MRLALSIFLAAIACAQTPPQPADVLARARVQLTAAAADTPRYTCTQTVDRKYFRETRQAQRSCDAIVAGQRNGRSKPLLEATDRLRFDVEVSDGGFEIYAWPGAARISNERIEEMAGGGPLGSGPFGPFLLDIFTNPGVEFQYLGEREHRFEYRYRVPVEASHYRVQAGTKWRVTAYDGAFLLEPATAALKQLAVRTLELPPDTSSCEATTSMQFESLRIGAGEYLIPSQTTLEVIGRDAGRTENSTVYSACREFRGESVVRFDDTPPVETNTSQRTGALLLATEIDTSRAAAGDAVSATLEKPLIDPVTGRVMAPAGALARGRITHLEHHLARDDYFLVGLTFDTLAGLPLHAILNRWHQVQDDRKLRGTTESRSQFPRGGTLILRSNVPRAYRTLWITM